MLVLVFFPLIFLLPLWHTRVSPSDSAWPSSSSLALSPFFFLLCSFFRSRTALVLVLSVRTPRTLGFVSTLYLCSPLSFSFHLSSYILFPYRPSGLPWLLPPTVMVRESESLFAKRLSVGVKTMVFFFMWNTDIPFILRYYWCAAWGKVSKVWPARFFMWM